MKTVEERLKEIEEKLDGLGGYLYGFLLGFSSQTRKNGDGETADLFVMQAEMIGEVLKLDEGAKQLIKMSLGMEGASCQEQTIQH